MGHAEKTDLIEQIRREGETVALDFTNPLHREWLFSNYGGEKTMRERLPALYEAYLRSVRNPDRRYFREGFRSDVWINGLSTSKENDRGSILAVASLCGRPVVMDGNLLVRDGDHSIWRNQYATSPDFTHQTLELPLDHKEGEQRKADYSVFWVDDQHQLLGMVASHEISDYLSYSKISKKIHIYEPKKRNGGNPPINICYNRWFLDHEDVDYQMSECFNTGTNKQILMIPMKGMVEFEEGMAPFREVIDAKLKLDCQNGTVWYRGGKLDEIRRQIDRHEKGFSIFLNPDWQAEVPASRWPIRDRVDLYFELKFILEDNKIGRIVIQSYDGTVSSFDQEKIGWFNLIWGCVAGGTKVWMADGSLKPVEQLKKGELVRTDSKGGQAAVSRVIAGQEQEAMLSIMTTKGNVLTCTKSHPIVTKNGPLKAEKLTGAHKVIGTDGDFLQICGIWEMPGGPVYNVSLEPVGKKEEVQGTTLFCEGILVGDNNMQAYVARPVMQAFASSRYFSPSAQYIREESEKKRIWAEMGEVL